MIRSRASQVCACIPRTASRAASTSATASAEPAPTPQAVAAPPVSSKQKAKQEAWDSMMEKVTDRRARRYTADRFTKLGSTQNRDTTFQPHQTLSSPPTPLSTTTSHLLASGAHLGHSPQLSHRAALPQIYGHRANLALLDLRQTLPALRRAAQVVQDVVAADGTVVFVGSLKGTEKAVFKNAERLGPNGYGVTKWLSGTISNAKEVFGWCEIPEAGEEERELTREKGSRSPTSFKPSLLVLLSPTLNQHALREATAHEVPTIGITDSDVDPRCVTYSIPANDDSPRAVELIAGVLGMAGKEGLRLKAERQAREKAARARREQGEGFARRLGNNY